VTGADRPRGVVTVGTDHHRFDRLMDWIDDWNRAHPGAVDWTVQHGSSRPLTDVEGFALKPHQDLLDDLQRADLVVTQGGPGGIMDSRACGVLPIVVPRLSHLGEVVDDHQVAFSRQLAATGLVALAESRTDLHALLDDAVDHPERFVVSDEPVDVTHTVEKFQALVEALVAAPRVPRVRRWSLRRR
jgi:UDP-N-acetylglucosamine transferase subunit ALG13